MNRYVEIENYDALQPLILPGALLEHYAFQNIEFGRNAVACRFKDCIFFGCTMPDVMRQELSPDCCVLPKLPVPFNPFPAQLYTAATLYAGYDYCHPDTFEQCYDTRIYRHYMECGRQAADISETLARSLHDHSMSDALHDMLAMYDERRVVAVMGGHALLRTDETYRKVVTISKHLAEQSFLMVTGGGPGAMEAAHLGVWLAGREDTYIDDAISLLAHAPSYKECDWLPSAFALMEKLPRVNICPSIGIPTWFYGHEPATPFATHIAKYFDNSIREDVLLAIAKGGVIYSPGSAGTMQEIFQDAAQNHYLTCGHASPMVFLHSEYWCEKFPIYPLLHSLQQSGGYKNLLLSLADTPADAEQTIIRFLKNGKQKNENCE
jgi:predicted Rossmann-fold nucleotide-binding protein